MTSCSSQQTSSFPTLYAAWMTELLGDVPPEESRATCSNCAMLPQEDDTPSDMKVFFDPRSKCCTYLPDLPNFLVGRILADEAPEMSHGRESMARRVDAKVAVTPLGVGQPNTYLLWYNHSKNAFGRSQTLRCPHYIEEGGLCGIWRHRESTCATWFCKHDRGATGQRFWRDGLHRLLTSVEGGLSRWCVLQHDLGTTAVERLLDLSDDYKTIAEGELDGNVDPAGYRALWGLWYGREREFFKACAASVNGLSWSDVAQICGPKVQLLARLTQEYYYALSRTDPDPALRCGSFRLISLKPEAARLSTYNDYDPVEVPPRLLSVLQYFEGQPTAEAIATIAQREGVQLSPELVRKLTDFALLVPPNKNGSITGPGEASRPGTAPGDSNSGPDGFTSKPR